MTYFEPEFLHFFKALAANNDRDWFQAHKGEYEEEVKKPFEIFITDVIKKLNSLDPELTLPAKDAIFRIYKDVRFSKDKLPYKTHCAAVISKYGRKNNHYPGLYIMLSAEKLMIGGGLYQPDKDSLYDVRESIYRHPEKIKSILAAPAFKSFYGEILGEKNKILPAAFKDKAETLPILFHKQFYYMADFPADTILRDDLMALVVEAFEAGRPLKEYLTQASGIK